MLPAKLRALNDCSSDGSSDDDDAPVKITKEALVSETEFALFRFAVEKRILIDRFGVVRMSCR